MCAEPDDDSVETASERVEFGPGHRCEERACERFVASFELRDESFCSRRESHQRCSPVRRMRLACHETASDERVHEPCYRARCDLQRGGKHLLSYRPTLPELPE